MPGDPIGYLLGQISAGAGISGGASSGVGGSETSFYMLLYTYWVQRFGLDQPLHVQYVVFLRNMLTFSFGPSIVYYPTDALTLVLSVLPWSLALLVPSIILGWYLGNFIGARAAYKKGIYDKIIYPFALIVSNFPYYWFALVLIGTLAGSIKLFPTQGAYGINISPSLTPAFIIDFLYHYTLPFISLLIPQIGRVAIGMRALTLYEMGSDYMEYSESLGFTEKKLVKYVSMNAILPQYSGLPMMLGNTLAGQAVTEVVFGYKGVGMLLYSSIMGQDYNVVQCTFTFIILVILIGNFLMDIIYAYVDPRIRLAYREE
jgi:peptide/nickel transport system permease protein